MSPGTWELVPGALSHSIHLSSGVSWLQIDNEDPVAAAGSPPDHADTKEKSPAPLLTMMNTPTYSFHLQAHKDLVFSSLLRHTHNSVRRTALWNKKERGSVENRWGFREDEGPSNLCQGRGSFIECKPFLQCCLSPYRAYKTIEDDDLKFPLIYGEGKKVGSCASQD